MHPTTIAFAALVFACLGILYLLFTPTKPNGPKLRNSFYVIDLLNDVDPEGLQEVLAGYANVLQVTPTTWYIVSTLSLNDIAHRLVNDYGHLKIAVYQVNDILSCGPRHTLDWLIQKGLQG
jgi:hypothetical protein